MSNVPIELYQLVLNKCDLKVQLRAKQVSNFMDRIRILDLANINQKYTELLSDSVLSNYTNVLKINLHHFMLQIYGQEQNYGHKVTKLGHMKNLQYVSLFGIELDDIAKLNPVVLSIPDYAKVELNHMTRLKVLYAEDSNLFDQCIKDLDLVKLNISGSTKISQIDHMTSLVELDIGDTQIDGEQIKNMTKLKVLDIYDTTIGDESIKSLDLVELNVMENPMITKFDHFTNLKNLYAGSIHEVLINDDMIKNLKLNYLEIHHQNLPFGEPETIIDKGKKLKNISDL